MDVEEVADHASDDEMAQDSKNTDDVIIAIVYQTVSSVQSSKGFGG
jgi:hypothetical protein